MKPMTGHAPKHGTLEPAPLETATFQGRLRWLRKLRGLTQVQLAEALGGEQTMISTWEVGRSRPSATALRALARFYGVTPVALETGAGFEDEARAAQEAFQGSPQAPGAPGPVPVTLPPVHPGQALAVDLALGTSRPQEPAEAHAQLAQALKEGREVWVVTR